MNELQTINSIIEESVKNSSYITVIISSCVFLIYTIIIRLVDYFKSKNSAKPLNDIASALRDNTLNIANLNNVLKKTLNDAERKENRQCESAIDLAFKAFGFKLSQECTAIIIHNNIEKNKELIVNNVHKLVNAEYYKLHTSLSMYEINDIIVSNKLKEEWIEDVAETLINIIYDNQENVVRIVQINNRLNIYINEFTTYINNKIF